MTLLLSSKIKVCASADGTEKYLTYWCQGCQDIHQVRVQGPGSWDWNGDAERPIFTPSVLTRQGHFAYDSPRDTCWCTYNAEQLAKGQKPGPFKCYRCHTFVGCNGAQPGEVIFLADCTHAFAGTVQPLPDLPDYLRGDK